MTRDAPDSDRPSVSHSRRIVWLALKWTLFAVVLAFVAQRGHAMWQRDGATLRGLDLRWSWIAAAMVCNTFAWLPSVWFWRRLMRQMGANLPFLPTARAYYCGHLGKYVPGKATVIVIRAALVKQYGLRAAPAALAVTFETLAMMGSGAAVAAALAPRLLTESQRAALPGWLNAALNVEWLPPFLVVVATAALLPILARLFTQVAVRMTPREILDREGPPRIDTRLLGQGLLAYLLTWILHGLCLDLSLRAVGAKGLSLAQLPDLIGAMAFATAGGFAVLFAPGGLGVREGLLIASLGAQSYLTPSQAVAGAVLTRLIAFVTEIVAAGALYYGIRPPKDPELSDA